MRSRRIRTLVIVAVIAVAAAGTWLGLRWQRASRLNEFLPIAEVFLARIEARDVATLKKLGLDSAGIANAFALPPQQVAEIIRGRLRVASGQVDGDFARILFDTKAAFCPANTGHPGLLVVQFIQQGGRWVVDRIDPEMC